MSGHTPGPWSIQRYTNYHGFSIWAAGRLLAERWYASPLDESGDAEMAANARVIAAAPEMLEALKWIAEQYPDMGCGPVAENAIARAEVRK